MNRANSAVTRDDTARKAQFPSPEVISRLAISNSGFVFDPVSGASFSVNVSGLAVLRAIQSGATDMNAIVNSLAAEFEAAPTVLRRDVMEFAGRLRDAFP